MNNFFHKEKKKTSSQSRKKPGICCWRSLFFFLWEQLMMPPTWWKLGHGRGVQNCTNGKGSLVFIDDETVDKSNGMDLRSIGTLKKKKKKSIRPCFLCSRRTTWSFYTFFIFLLWKQLKSFWGQIKGIHFNGQVKSMVWSILTGSAKASKIYLALQVPLPWPKNCESSFILYSLFMPRERPRHTARGTHSVICQTLRRSVHFTS